MQGSRQKASQQKQVLPLSIDSMATDELKCKRMGNKVFITSRPKMICHYNAFMGGVDSADQMLPIVIWMHSALLENSNIPHFFQNDVHLYILYKMNTDKPISKLAFKILIIEAITEEWLGDPTPVQHTGFCNDPLYHLLENKQVQVQEVKGEKLVTAANIAMKAFILCASQSTGAKKRRAKRESGTRPSVFVDDLPLNETESTKFLGMFLDRGLTWDVHVDHVCAIVASGIFALCNLAKHCPIMVLKMAYNGLIYPTWDMESDFGAVVNSTS
ncbi:hypothetical protein J6590_064617 [Homalodisca vitripennis]|nr:hypothetical protein J6590_064617 [Homalodisca vitripennis]